MDIRQILDFLAALRENNNRAWMEANQADYQQARGTFVKIADFLMKGIEPLDESIAGLEPRRCIFRINRDVRFSKDKSPYKTNMGAYLTKGGRHGSYAGYYLHLEPYDQSFMAGGIYQPSADALKKIRQEIDYNGDDLTKIIDTPGFRELFGSLQGEKLKRPPQGYNADHPQIEWLKMKSFLVMHPAKDRTITQKYFLSYVLDIFRNIIPFNKFLNTAINN
jgi:uncharacterized protein (TIGR02453 family)